MCLPCSGGHNSRKTGKKPDPSAPLPDGPSSAVGRVKGANPRATRYDLTDADGSNPVTVPDADGVDAVALFFVAQADTPLPDTAALRAHADRLPPYQRPHWLHPIDALPRTPTGKLVRRRLRELHRELVADASSNTCTEVTGARR